MTFALAYAHETQQVLVEIAPGMPADYWWVTAWILLILGLTATVDAFTAYIPDIMIFLGLLAVALTQGLYVSWEIAGDHLLEALAAGLFLWAINFAWTFKFRYDGLGMADVKWTMLAVACFGVLPVVYAWGLGAVLAAVLSLLMRLVNYRMSGVTFSPFLLIGLGLGLFFVRFW